MINKQAKNFLKKAKRIPKVIDTLFGTDYTIKARNHLIGFHTPNYRFERSEIAFVHVPKSGGTSLHKILGSINSHSRFTNLNMHRPISRFCNPEKYSYITIMRDPVERVWSYYNMALRNDIDNPYHKFSLKGIEYFLNHCWEVRNMACRYYSGQVRREPNDQNLDVASHNLKHFKYVLDFSNLDEEIGNLLQDCNLPKTPIPHERISNNTHPEKNERDLIILFNRLDIELFDKWKANCKNG